jgi:hypothetical protein
MGRSQEQSMIDDLKRSCSLVDVDAQYGQCGWRIRGRRLGFDGKPIMDGSAVIDVRHLYLKTAKKHFEEAYAKAMAMGIIKNNAR